MTISSESRGGIAAARLGVLLVGLLLGGCEHPGPQPPTAAAARPGRARPDDRPAITIAAGIRGRSHLYLRGNTARWRQFAVSASDLTKGVCPPTIINGKPWRPVWPDLLQPPGAPPPAGSLPAFSDTFRKLSPPLPTALLEVALEAPGDPAQVRIVQHPQRANGYTLVLAFESDADGRESIAATVRYRRVQPPPPHDAAPFDPKRGLAAHYPFDGNATDAHGSHDGAASRTTASIDRFGKKDLAYAFTAPKSFVQIAAPPPLAGQALSVSAWVLWAPRAAPPAFALNNVIVSQENGFALGHVGRRLAWRYLPDGPPLLAPAGQQTARWRHVAAIHDGQRQCLYVDGDLVAQRTTSSARAPGGVIYVGTERSRSRATYFGGLIDELRLYGRALNAADVAALYLHEALPTQRLFPAAAAGDLPALEKLWSNAALRAVDGRKNSLLHAAIRHGRHELIPWLLEKGVPVATPNDRGRTPLHQAVTEHSLPLVELLLKNSANPQLPDRSGLRPLHLAVAYGGDEIAARLLEAGADPKIAAGGGATPTHLAALFGRIDLLRLLAAKTENSQLSLADAAGHTPLHLAAWTGSAATIIALLELGADETVPDKAGRRPEDWLAALHPDFFAQHPELADHPRLLSWLVGKHVRILNVVPDPRRAVAKLRMHIVNPLDEPLDGTLSWKTPPGSGWRLQPAKVSLTIDSQITELVSFRAEYRLDGPILPLPTLEVELRRGEGQPFVKQLPLPCQPQDFLAKLHFSAECPRLPDRIAVDGKLAEKCWQRPPSAIHYIREGLTAPPTVATQTWLGYNDKGVVLAFRCREPNMPGLVAREASRDRNVIREDSITVYLDPELKRTAYSLLAVNAAGGAYARTAQSATFEGSWQAATSQEDGAWTLEMSVPWATLGVDAMKAGGKLGLQLLRYRPQSAERFVWPATLSGARAPVHFATIHLVDK